MKSAVLLIVFNRPGPTAAVFEALRTARPPRLYVAADGPRATRPDDQENCRAVRQIVEGVDWPCEVFPLFREHNLGCKRAVSAAITWFFDQEPEGIILEDDCVPTSAFFSYCDEMLERYREDERIAQICGSSFVPSPCPDKSYYFSKYADIWGWASWRRAWSIYDLEMREWPIWRDAGGLKRLVGSSPAFTDYWTRIFDETYAGGVDTWDYQWMFACWKNELVSVLPRDSQILNIGFGHDATHTGVDVPSYVAAVTPLSFPLVYNDAVVVDPATERRIARIRYFIRGATEAAVQLRRVPLVGPAAVNFAKWLKSKLIMGV